MNLPRKDMGASSVNSRIISVLLPNYIEKDRGNSHPTKSADNLLHSFFRLFRRIVQNGAFLNNSKNFTPKLCKFLETSLRLRGWPLGWTRYSNPMEC